jgi:Flp pilus assembly protein TadG
MPLARLRSLPSGTAGTAAIEFALLAPVVFLMFLGIVEFGRLLWTQASLQYAVQASARCASLGLSQCATSDETKNYAASQMMGPAVAASAFAVAACTNNGTQVSISLPFTFVVRKLFPWTITLSSQACYPGAQS